MKTPVDQFMEAVQLADKEKLVGLVKEQFEKLVNQAEHVSRLTQECDDFRKEARLAEEALNEAVNGTKGTVALKNTLSEVLDLLWKVQAAINDYDRTSARKYLAEAIIKADYR